jgi:hypothetical protein
MVSYTELIEKLKNILSQELGNKKIFDKDIAIALEIDYDKFRKQKSRNGLIPYYEIMSFLAKRNISINWFFFNQLPETLIDSTSNYIILKYQKSIITSAGGGAMNYEIDPTPLVIDKLLLDYINSSYKYTEVMHVFGESMEPDIKDGSLVFIDKSQLDINNQSVLAINTPDGLYIKKIKTKGSEYYMCSYNNNCEDVKLEEFEVIGRATGVYNKI